MKRVLLTLVIYLWTSAFVFATTVPPVPLNDRVKTADHIFVGVATEIAVVDAKGNVITNVPDSTHLDLAIRLTVTPKRVLRTPLKNFPDRVVFTYGRGFILGVQAERNRLLGKEMYYLLSGASFNSVHALQFREPMEKEKEIIEHLKDKPTE